MQFGSCTNEVPLAAKVAFLSSPKSYEHEPSEVVALETHMSWVFLAGEKAFKLKKPVLFPYLDFRSLEARELNSMEEVRLNRRLAGATYTGIKALRLGVDGCLSLGTTGQVIDWLVEMRRLPAELMLDRMILTKRAAPEHINAVAGALARFYLAGEPSGLSPQDYVNRFGQQHRSNREVILQDFRVSGALRAGVLDAFEQVLANADPLLRARVRDGHIIEGHGDLRPEHVCLTQPVVIFDCLEFSRELRLVDPFDEVAFLSLECAALGADWVRPVLLAEMSERLCDRPPSELVRVYGAFRAIVRARLAFAHLFDPHPREPDKWEPLAERYLRLAEELLAQPAR